MPHPLWTENFWPYRYSPPRTRNSSMEEQMCIPAVGRDVLSNSSGVTTPISHHHVSIDSWRHWPHGSVDLLGTFYLFLFMSSVLLDSATRSLPGCYLWSHSQACLFPNAHAVHTPCLKSTISNQPLSGARDLHVSSSSSSLLPIPESFTYRCFLDSSQSRWYPGWLPATQLGV